MSVALDSVSPEIRSLIKDLMARVRALESRSAGNRITTIGTNVFREGPPSGIGAAEEHPASWYLSIDTANTASLLYYSTPTSTTGGNRKWRRLTGLTLT